MKKIFFLFLAFFAVNFIFAQTRETVIVEEVNGKTVYQKVGSDDYYSDEWRDPCPPCPPCRKKPVKKSATSTMSSKAPNINIINISTTGESSVEIDNFNGNKGGVNVRVNAGKQKKVDTVTIHDPFYWDKKITYPFYFGDSVIMSPIEAPIPVPLPHTFPNRNGNYPTSAPDSGSGFPLEKFGYPFFLAFLLGLLMFWGAYLVGRFRSIGTSSITSITSETGPAVRRSHRRTRSENMKEESGSVVTSPPTNEDTKKS